MVDGEMDPMTKNPLLEKGFKLFYEKRYADAASVFNEVLADISFEPAHTYRIKQFKTLAEHRCLVTKDFEEQASLANAVYHLNRGQYEAAERTLAKAQLAKGLEYY